MVKSLTFTTSFPAVDRNRGGSIAPKIGRGIGALAAIAPAHGIACSSTNGVLRFGSNSPIDRRDLSIVRQQLGQLPGQQNNGGLPGPKSGRYSVNPVSGLD